MLSITKYPKREQWGKLLRRPALETDFLESSVKNILTRVQQSGDRALFEFSKQFDKVDLNELTVSESEIKTAQDNVDKKLQSAIKLAHDNIYAFHSQQHRQEAKVETMPGITCWRKPLPIEKVGLYIPGGSAPLFSSVLMLGIPAKIADCKEVLLCTPPNTDGSVNAAILYTAQLVGIKKIYKIGGAQAIAALAYGTETIPKVDKIFGPGNQYVTAAKQLVSMKGTAIDMPAGPSEVMVIADASSNPSFIASDLLSQAEHGQDSQVVLLCTDERMIEKVNERIAKQIEVLPRKDIALTSLKQSTAVLMKDETEMMELSNYYAPEHLIIATKTPDQLAEQVVNAGSVFIGPYTPEAAGDYASGTNHTLPTNGAAKAYSGVSLDSFLKQVTFQKITEKGINALGESVEIMAEAEQLIAHKNAISVRLNSLNNGN